MMFGVNGASHQLVIPPKQQNNSHGIKSAEHYARVQVRSGRGSNFKSGLVWWVLIIFREIRDE
jgi:hypothetical protein